MSLLSRNTKKGDTTKVENKLMEMDAYIFGNVYNDFKGKQSTKYWPSIALRQEAIEKIGINKLDAEILKQVKQQMKQKFLKHLKTKGVLQENVSS